MTVKLVVIYPRPKDVEAFEAVYNRDHVPMAVEKLAGKTKIVATRVLGSPAGEPPFHRGAECISLRWRPSNNAQRRNGEQTIANAGSISSGRAPVFLVAEEGTLYFEWYRPTGAPAIATRDVGVCGQRSRTNQP